VVSAIAGGVLLDDETFRVRSVSLDHKIPCLAFSLEEKNHVNVMKDRLNEQGIPVGPWLTGLKRAVLRGDPDTALFRIWWREGSTVQERFRELGVLKKEILRIVPGQKITYVTDVAGSAVNIFRIRELAAGSDYLFIEAMFLQKDEEMARKKSHLTARQAGTLAREAGAARVTPFHFSPKYSGQGEELLREVADAFKD
jgi:ribonuclease Z